jgi:hypothetical protein
MSRVTTLFCGLLSSFAVQSISIILVSTWLGIVIRQVQRGHSALGLNSLLLSVVFGQPIYFSIGERPYKQHRGHLLTSLLYLYYLQKFEHIRPYRWSRPPEAIVDYMCQAYHCFVPAVSKPMPILLEQRWIRK